MFKKAIFDSYLEKYRRSLIPPANPNLVLWHETLANFKDQWDIETLDFKSMYDRSLKSKINTSLWKGDDYHPKEVVMEFIDYDKEIARTIFRDLLDERREVSGRMERFVFYCDQLLKETQARGSKFYGHYHNGYFMVSLYLTYVYPEKYTLYDYTVFSVAMQSMGTASPPRSHELDRYFKITKIVKKFLCNDEDLVESYDALTQKYAYDPGIHPFLAFDFLTFVAKNPF